MTMKAVAYFTILSFAACFEGFAGDRVEHRVVRVRQTPGGPVTFVDDKPVAPHMFWGRENMRALPVGAEWQEYSVPILTNVTVNGGYVLFKFQPGAGMLEVRNFRIERDGTNISPVLKWRLGGETKDAKALKTAENGASFTVDFRRNHDANAELSSQTFNFPAGSRSVLRFEAKAEGISWIRPRVRHQGPGPFFAPCHDVAPANLDHNTLAVQARLAAAAGVRFFSFYAPLCWMPEGEESYETLDHAFDSIISVCPDALIVPRVTLNAPAWWIKTHPECRMVMEKPPHPMYASVSSALYRKEALEYLRRTIRHLMKKYPYNFAGIHPSGQNTNEWFYQGSLGRMCGYDPCTKESFREWLRRNGDDGWTSAEVPTPVERRAAVQDPLGVINPVKYSRIIQFNRYLQDEMCDFVAEVSRVAREETEGKKLVLTFFGYGWELSFALAASPAGTGHYAFRRFLDKASSYVDMICAPNSYRRSRGWLGSTPQMVPVETIHRKGILWVAEDDTRTYLVPRPRLDESPNYSGCATQSQTKDVYSRNLAFQAVRGMCSWWMDLFGDGWQEDPELWSVLKRYSPADALLLTNRKSPYAPDVAFLLDEESMLFVAPKNKTPKELFENGRIVYPVCGATYGQYLLEDVLSAPLDAKLHVIPVAYYCNEEKARRYAQWREKMTGESVMWCVAPACFSNKGFDLEMAKRVTGFDFEPSPDSSALIVRPKDGDEVWECNADGTPSIVVRRNADGGCEFFSSKVDVSAEMWAKIAKRAGAHLYHDRPGDAAVFASDGFVAVQAHKDGRYCLQMPGVGDVKDVPTGNKVGSGRSIDIDLRMGEVRLLEQLKMP